MKIKIINSSGKAEEEDKRLYIHGNNESAQMKVYGNALIF